MKKALLITLILFITSTSNVLAQTVYTTKTGEKYHKANCRYLKYSKTQITFDKALELGYTACMVCKPTRENTKATANQLSGTQTSATTSKPSAKKAVATQCTGKTQAGKRCKRKTKNANGKCYQHQ
ncbi:hypothetical protein AB9K26_02355 [Psychroserpens sp. XS_ASV72]|uniref:hypothetical protein n=1 Tax=Psychroserpens sp. XS_ASV72 TaxID=3241293 RepID=UPI0035180D71